MMRAATAPRPRKHLRIMVPELRARGYEFVRISDLAGITREQAMPLLTHARASDQSDQCDYVRDDFFVPAFSGNGVCRRPSALGIARVIFVTTLALISHFRSKNVATPVGLSAAGERHRSGVQRMQSSRPHDSQRARGGLPRTSKSSSWMMARTTAPRIWWTRSSRGIRRCASSGRTMAERPRR